MASKLESLRMRAIALRSSIHNEHQLSAIELCAMNARKTNEIIDVVNELCDFIEDMGTTGGSVSLEYNPATEEITLKGAES